MRDTPRLKFVREGLALSQRDLAAMSGVAHDTIGQLERGERKARPSTIRKLAEALGVTPSVLLAESEKAAWSEMNRARDNQGQQHAVPKEQPSIKEDKALANRYKQHAIPSRKPLISPLMKAFRAIKVVWKAWEDDGKWAECYVSGQSAHLPESVIQHRELTDEDRSNYLSLVDENYLNNTLQLPRGIDAEEINIAWLKLDTDDLKEIASVGQRTFHLAWETIEDLRKKQESFDALPESYFEDPVARRRIEALDKALQQYRKEAVEAAQKLLTLHAEALLSLEERIHDIREGGEKLAVLTRRVESHRYDKRES